MILSQKDNGSASGRRFTGRADTFEAEGDVGVAGQGHLIGIKWLNYVQPSK